MINKYTLQFKDKQLETQYQQHQLNQTRYPLFKHLIIGLLIAGSVRLFQLTIFNKSDSWPLYLALIIVVLALGLFVSKKRQFLRMALVLINHLMILTSLEIDEECSPNYYYMRGASMMSLHIIIFMSGEILETYFSIVSITSIRLFLLFQQDQIFPYAAILLAILIIGYFQYTIYKNNLAFRNQFQLSFLDHQWDQVITQLIDQPYLLIDYNENLLTFRYKKSKAFQFNCESNDDLKYFLRNSKVQGEMNLEKYYFTLLSECIFKDNSSLLKQTIDVNFEKLDITIQYSIFQGIQPMILIQIIQLGEGQFLKIPQQAKVEKLYEFKYKKLLQQTLSRLDLIIKNHGNSNLLFSIYKQVFYLILIEYCQCLSIQTIYSFNIGVVFKKLKLIYHNKLLCIENNIKSHIIGNKQLISLLLITVIEYSSSNLIKMKTELGYEFYLIIIEGNFNLKAQYTLNFTLHNYCDFFLDYTIEQQSVKIKFYNDITFEKTKQFKQTLVHNLSNKYS